MTTKTTCRLCWAPHKIEHRTKAHQHGLLVVMVVLDGSTTTAQCGCMAALAMETTVRRKMLVLISSLTYYSDTLEDMWVFNESSTTWVPVAYSGSSHPIVANAATWYDPSAHMMYLFGGEDHLRKNCMVPYFISVNLRNR